MHDDRNSGPIPSRRRYRRPFPKRPDGMLRRLAMAQDVDETEVRSGRLAWKRRGCGLWMPAHLPSCWLGEGQPARRSIVGWPTDGCSRGATGRVCLERSKHRFPAAIRLAAAHMRNRRLARRDDRVVPDPLRRSEPLAIRPDRNAAWINSELHELVSVPRRPLLRGSEYPFDEKPCRATPATQAPAMTQSTRYSPRAVAG